MRIKLTFAAQKPLVLPIHYNAIVQGLIYHALTPKTATQLHDRGYRHNSRVFRNFTFSNLQGPFVIAPPRITFTGAISLVIASAEAQILSEFCATALGRSMSLAGQDIMVRAVEIIPTPVFGTTASIRMLSPMAMYSTVLQDTGKKFTRYHSPFDPEFSDMIASNLQKKFLSFYPDGTPEAIRLSITPKSVTTKDQKILKYNGGIIKGWMGTYRLEGTPEALRFAWLAGLGGKNAQGLGCWEEYIHG